MNDLNSILGPVICRTLTEFLGECWHKWLPCDDSLGRFCIECDTEEEDCTNYYLDFSDWRVVGRLIEKVLGASMDIRIWPGNLCEIKAHGKQLAVVYTAESSQEAICRAVYAWLQEKGEG